MPLSGRGECRRGAPARCRGLPVKRGEDFVARTEHLHLAVAQHQHAIDDREDVGAVGDDDERGAARLLRVSSVCSSARSPASSRLELGSSRTMNCGSL